MLSATTRFVAYSDLVRDIQSYIDGYHSAQRGTAPVTIAIGTNNDMDVNAADRPRPGPSAWSTRSCAAPAVQRHHRRRRERHRARVHARPTPPRATGSPGTSAPRTRGLRVQRFGRRLLAVRHRPRLQQRLGHGRAVRPGRGRIAVADRQPAPGVQLHDGRPVEVHLADRHGLRPTADQLRRPAHRVHRLRPGRRLRQHRRHQRLGAAVGRPAVDRPACRCPACRTRPTCGSTVEPSARPDRRRRSRLVARLGLHRPPTATAKHAPPAPRRPPPARPSSRRRRPPTTTAAVPEHVAHPTPTPTSSAPDRRRSTSPTPTPLAAPTFTTTCTTLTVRVIPRRRRARRRDRGPAVRQQPGPVPCTIYGLPTRRPAARRRGRRHAVRAGRHPGDRRRTLAPGDTAESLLTDFSTCQAPLSDTVRVSVPARAGRAGAPVVAAARLRACTLRVAARRRRRPDRRERTPQTCGASDFPVLRALPDAVVGRRHLRPRQQRRALPDVRHRGERLADRGVRGRHPRRCRPSDSSSRRPADISQNCAFPRR